VTSLGVQVHGGMGFIEETGAAQHYRDARILPIYEGTTAIQANDLIGRKTVRDGGETAKAIIAQVRGTASELAESPSVAHGADLKAIAHRLALGARALEDVVDYVVANIRTDVKGVFAGSVTYLKLAGIVLGGWQMARAAGVAVAKLDAGAPDADFYRAKLATARFFADHLVALAGGMRDSIVDGSAAVMALDNDQF
jgi:hypothetical protein